MVIEHEPNIGGLRRITTARRSRRSARTTHLLADNVTRANPRPLSRDPRVVAATPPDAAVPRERPRAAAAAAASQHDDTGCTRPSRARQRPPSPADAARVDGVRALVDASERADEVLRARDAVVRARSRATRRPSRPGTSAAPGSRAARGRGEGRARGRRGARRRGGGPTRASRGELGDVALVARRARRRRRRAAADGLPEVAVEVAGGGSLRGEGVRRRPGAVGEGRGRARGTHRRRRRPRRRWRRCRPWMRTRSGWRARRRARWRASSADDRHPRSHESVSSARSSLFGGGFLRRGRVRREAIAVVRGEHGAREGSTEPGASARASVAAGRARRDGASASLGTGEASWTSSSLEMRRAASGSPAPSECHRNFIRACASACTRTPRRGRHIDARADAARSVCDVRDRDAVALAPLGGGCGSSRGRRALARGAHRRRALASASPWTTAHADRRDYAKGGGPRAAGEKSITPPAFACRRARHADPRVPQVPRGDRRSLPRSPPVAQRLPRCSASTGGDSSRSSRSCPSRTSTPSATASTSSGFSRPAFREEAGLMYKEISRMIAGNHHVALRHTCSEKASPRSRRRCRRARAPRMGSHRFGDLIG